MKIEDLQTPFYLCDLRLLDKNLQTLNAVAKASGCEVLCALKGFAFSGAMGLCASRLDGATCSGLGEARYAAKHGFKQVCTYSPAFKESEIDEILDLSDHIVFNSFSQLARFGKKAKTRGVQIAIRLNPQTSFSPVDAYNPCGRFSRLGVTRQALQEALKNEENAELFSLLDGVHFHALCEESAQSLKVVLEAVERDFGEFLRGLKWVNFGGGHHITKEGYDTALLCRLIRDFSARHNTKVILEPGEAVGWQTGTLVASVLDIVQNEKTICIIDASPECHMPDTVLMPYRPQIRGEIAPREGAFECLFGGATCLAGDIVGVEAGEPNYCFKEALKVGDRVIFEDQIHYTIVKNNTFNGVKLPNLAQIELDGTVRLVREFDYDEYARRN